MESMNAVPATAQAMAAAHKQLSVPNAVEMFRDRVRRSGTRTAIRWKEGGQWREASWNDFDRTGRQIAAGLITLGLEAGDRCCLLSNSRPEWLYSDVGILMGAMVTVPIYQSNLAHECEYIVNDSGARVLLAEDPSQVAKLVSQRDKLGNVVKVVYFDASVTLPKPDAQGRTELKIDDVVPADLKGWVMSLGELRVEGDKWLGKNQGELERRWAEIKPDHRFTIVYTSGTTGPPKGVVLTHSNMVWECDVLDPVLPVDENDDQLLFLPMAHIFAKLLGWVSIRRGSQLTFAESINKVRDNMAETRPTFMCAVPRVLEKVYLAIKANRDAAPPMRQRIFDWAFAVGREVSKLKQQGKAIPLGLGIKNALATRLVFSKIHALLGGRMRFMVSGGAPLTPEIAEFFFAAGVILLEGWGLTETTAGTCVNRPDQYRIGTVGPPVPGVELKIASDGEILVRSGSVMKEYFNRPADTREAIDDEGWFHTGDIGVIEDGGFLRITDRKKDLIVNANGKNIAPQNLESALKATPYISQVLVHGDKRPYLVALITLNEDSVTKWARAQGIAFASVEELAKDERVRALVQKSVDELNASEPSYSSIKKFAILPHDFSQETGELTPKMSVKRKFTSTKYKDILDAFYAN